MKKQITIKDKSFVSYIEHDEIQNIVFSLSQKINETYKDQDLIIVGVLSGSFMLLSDLVKKISPSISATISFIKVSSYSGDTISSGQVKNIMGLDIDIKGKNVLLVEDILDTLGTINYLKAELSKQNPFTLSTVALLSKKKDPGKNIIYGKLIPDYFVIGYGMDYSSLGRNLTDIYKLES